MSRRLVVTLVTMSLFTGCTVGGEDEDEGTGIDCSEGACDISTTALCTAKVKNKGTRDVETDYLAHVVACENPGVGMEALKAQAIAARSYLYYVVKVEKRSIKDGQGDQVYGCGTPPTPEIIAAVEATSGKVMTYKGSYVATFYVAGARQTGPSCKGGKSDPTRTEKYVTYNEGKSGRTITQTRLGYRSASNLANRGAMSQNGSACLAETGTSAEDILRFYYGEDIDFTQMEGTCVTDPTPNSIGKACVDNTVCTAAGEQPSECLTWADTTTSVLSGFCSVDCTGTCPGSTMCTELTTGIGTAQCMPKATTTNNFCADIPGTDLKVMSRFGTSRSEINSICAPPQATAISCTDGTDKGECIDTEHDTCGTGSTIHTGLCPGGATIRCCTTPATTP